YHFHAAASNVNHGYRASAQIEIEEGASKGEESFLFTPEDLQLHLVQPFNLAAEVSPVCRFANGARGDRPDLGAKAIRDRLHFPDRTDREPHRLFTELPGTRQSLPEAGHLAFLVEDSIGAIALHFSDHQSDSVGADVYRC